MKERSCTSISTKKPFARLCKTAIMSYASLMANDTILALIDAEIARLTQVRSLLASAGKVADKVTERITKKAAKKAGKARKAPKAAKAAKAAKAPKAPKAAKVKKRRTLSPEARQRIADAQRKRWAAQKAKA
jgi:Cdc6-like AAA superfamily ATPase